MTWAGRTWRRWVWMLVGLGAAVLALRALASSHDELLGAGHALGRVSAAWLVVAVAAETASYVAFALAQRRLLRAAGRRVGLGFLTALALATQAVGDCLPAGFAVANVLSFRVLRWRGVGAALIGWMLVVDGVLYVATIAVLTVIGAQIAGPAHAIPDLQLVAGAVLGVLAVAGTAIALARRRQGARRWSARLADRAVMAAEQTPGLRRAAPQARVQAWRQELGAVSLRPVGWAVAAAWLLGYWLADIACLVASFDAIGAGTPWRGLLLAYGAGQLAASLPVTPGGLGVVEGSLTVALVAYGGAAPATLAAVLLYRLISFWALLPVGGLAYLWLRRLTPSPPRPERTEQLEVTR